MIVRLQTRHLGVPLMRDDGLALPRVCACDGYVRVTLNNHPLTALFKIEWVAILRRLWTPLLRIHYVLYYNIINL